MRHMHKIMWGVALFAVILGLVGIIDPVKAALLGLLAGGAAEVFED